MVTENYRKGTMEKLGLGYEALQHDQPGASSTARSPASAAPGPTPTRGGYDLIAQGMSGLMAITGEPGRAPVKYGAPICDINAGMLGALGVVAAYVHRLKTGAGQLVDTSLFEAGIHQTFWHAAIYFATGEAPGPSGSAHILSAPYQAFRAADGWLTIGGANQANWERLVRVLGAPELARDPRFRSNSERMKNLGALTEVLSKKLGSWKEERPARGARGSGRALRPDQLDRRRGRRSAGAGARNGGRARASARRAHPCARAADQAFGHAGGVARPAPTFGQHTREVLAEFGFSGAEIDALYAANAVA